MPPLAHLPPFRLSRRQALQSLASGFGYLAFAGLAHAEAARQAAGSDDPLAPKPTHFPARAKRVIFLCMNGGPSHVDTFDPKPALQARQGEQPPEGLYKKSKGSGFMPSPCRFQRCGRSGIEVSETLPQIGRVIDDCAVPAATVTTTSAAALHTHRGTGRSTGNPTIVTCQNAIVQNVMATMTFWPGIPSIETAANATSNARVTQADGGSLRRTRTTKTPNRMNHKSHGAAPTNPNSTIC